jgi:hypothetical protein
MNKLKDRKISLKVQELSSVICFVKYALGFFAQLV